MAIAIWRSSFLCGAVLYCLRVTTQTSSSPHPLAPSPKLGEGEPNQPLSPSPFLGEGLG
jgi:hypothetical protein